MSAGLSRLTAKCAPRSLRKNSLFTIFVFVYNTTLFEFPGARYYSDSGILGILDRGFMELVMRCITVTNQMLT